MKQLSVAVVLANYNHARYLQQSLSAIISQTRPADEIVVIDDGSTDESVSIIEKVSAGHPTIRFIRNERNLGLQESIGRALAVVTADYLVWAASDNRLLPPFLERSMALLERYPHAGLCFSELSILQGDSERVERFAAIPWVAHIFDLADLPEYMTPEDIRRRMRRAYLPITTNSVVFRREALLAIGGFPRALEWYADSFAASVLALRHGACVIADTLAVIRSNPGSYSERGMRDRRLHLAVLTAMLDLLARPAFRDIRRAFLHCPSNFSPGLTVMLEAQLRHPRDWDLFASYLFWKIREYKRGHQLTLPRLVSHLGRRLARVVDRRISPQLRRRQPNNPVLLLGRTLASWWAAISDLARRRHRRGPTVTRASRSAPPWPRLGHHYTLIIPTYDRPSEVRRLLDYLEAKAASFPIVVLDSSHQESHQRNAERIGRSPLAIAHRSFSPDTHPYAKIATGLEDVHTPYCSVCADDDIVLLPALAECVGVLENHHDAVAAHGYYFNFQEGDFFDLSYVVYRGPSIEADEPIDRLRALFGEYEALFYAVFRTDVMRQLFDRSAKATTVLGRELAMAALAVILGKVTRTTRPYYGRNTTPSLGYEDWHPHQILATRPATLIDEYGNLRHLLVDALMPHSSALGHDRVAKIVDLIFVRYLSAFLRPEVLDLIIDDTRAGINGAKIAKHLWDTFVFPKGRDVPLEPLMSPDGTTFAPGRFLEGAPPRDYIVTRTAGVRVSRTYRIYHDFFFPTQRPPAVVGREFLLSTLDELDAY